MLIRPPSEPPNHHELEGMAKTVYRLVADASPAVGSALAVAMSYIDLINGLLALIACLMGIYLQWRRVRKSHREDAE